MSWRGLALGACDDRGTPGPVRTDITMHPHSIPETSKAVRR